MKILTRRAKRKRLKYSLNRISANLVEIRRWASENPDDLCNASLLFSSEKLLRVIQGKLKAMETSFHG